MLIRKVQVNFQIARQQLTIEGLPESVGKILGTPEGFKDGAFEGTPDGAPDGAPEEEGTCDGLMVGETVGTYDIIRYNEQREEQTYHMRRAHK